MVKQPFVIQITETFVREVAIEAESVFQAEEIAENLCNDGTIDLGANDFRSREVHWMPQRRG